MSFTTAVAPGFAEAQRLSRETAEAIQFEGKIFRRDIGWQQTQLDMTGKTSLEIEKLNNAKRIQLDIDEQIRQAQKGSATPIDPEPFRVRPVVTPGADARALLNRLASDLARQNSRLTLAPVPDERYYGSRND